MRMSDWSSDVCSSDLVGLLRTRPPAEPYAIARVHRSARALGIGWPEARSYPDFICSLDPTNLRGVAMMIACTTVLLAAAFRSEEHTYELQSRMRSSYDVLSLKKKKVMLHTVGDKYIKTQKK